MAPTAVMVAAAAAMDLAVVVVATRRRTWAVAHHPAHMVWAEAAGRAIRVHLPRIVGGRLEWKAPVAWVS
ncbi:hypothetical protein, partial [Salmonella enterica]|uniref:hypothetical protein n=1 Tax=Salmonella enterica TaxID=28901 RepID=UPI003D28870E